MESSKNDDSVEENYKLFRRAVRLGNLTIARRTMLSILDMGLEHRIAFCQRLYNVMTEDIGPANPSLIITVDNMLNADEFNIKDPSSIETIEKVVRILVDSPKSNVLVWMSGMMNGCDFPQEYEDIIPALRRYLLNLSQYLEESEENSLATVERILRFDDLNTYYTVTKSQWSILCSDHSRPKLIKYYRRICHQVWIPIIFHVLNKQKSQQVANLVCHLYYIACVRDGPFSFRSTRPTHRCVIYAIWAIFHPNEVEETWDNRIFEISHSGEVEELGECGDSTEDLIFVDRQINNLPVRLRPVENFWLDKCIDVWKTLEVLPKDEDSEDEERKDEDNEE